LYMIGKVTIKLVLANDREERELFLEYQELGYRAVVGKVGSMTAEKIVAAIETAVQREQLLDAAIETAVQREQLLDNTYRHAHSLYHAIIDSFYGVCRGQLELKEILRTVGLNFAVVRGPRIVSEDVNDGEWLAVALYGTIGAPKKGFEHEVMGLGINHL